MYTEAEVNSSLRTDRQVKYGPSTDVEQAFNLNVKPSGVSI